MNATRPEDRPTLGERYGRATVSSNLRVGERQGDADLLIAAGWLRDHIGALLFRLGHEFDAAKGEHGLAKAEFDRMERVACELEASAARLTGPYRKPGPLDTAADVRESAVAQALTAHLMTLIHLRSLRAAKDALFVFAATSAQREGLEFSGELMAQLVGQALELHLDPTCHVCQGRGRNGGYLAAMVVCRECCGSGQRTANTARKNALQARFVEWLMGEMRRMLGQAGAGIGKALRQPGPDDEQGRRMGEQEVADRLAELRSAQAHTD